MPEKTLGSVELASGHDELSSPQFTHGKQPIALLDIGRTDRVLDVGCGTGRLAAFTVERVGAEGRVVGVDPMPPRIQLALQRGDRRLEFRIGQAQDLSPFGDATFDVAYMNSVLNWIDDRPKAFGEAYRVLKPRGRLGVATTVRDRPNQLRLLAHRAERIATGRGTDTATDNSLSEQCGSKYAATAAEIRDMLEVAGFVVQTLEVRNFTSVFRDVGQIFDFLRATMIGQLAPGASDASYAGLRQAMKTLLAGEYAHCVSDEGIRLERYVLLAVAEKPH